MTNASGGAPRTQEQRRAATVSRLLESTVGALVELGYAGATTRIICERAGVSQGALFRHFATRRDLIVSTLEHLYESGRPVLREMLQSDLGGYSPERIADQIRGARDYLRESRNMAFLEVLIAARTEPDLHAALAPLLARHERSIRTIAARNPMFAQLSGQSQRVWLDCAYHLLWAEALWRTVLPESEFDDSKIDAVVRMGFVLAEREGVARPL